LGAGRDQLPGLLDIAQILGYQMQSELDRIVVDATR
jgi:hypothetical protein